MRSIEDIKNDFLEAINKNNISKVNEILDEISSNSADDKEYEEIIHTYHNYAFRWAAESGHIDVMDKLLELTIDPIKRNTMIHAEDDFAFRWAAANGHINIMDKLLQLIPDAARCEIMIHGEGDDAFVKAAESGHIDVMDKLLALTPDAAKRGVMIHAEDNHAFRWASASGHIDVMDKLLALTLDPIKREAMIHGEGDDAFVKAAAYGHIDCFIYLCSLVNQDMINDIIKEALESINESSIECKNLMQPYLNDPDRLKSLANIYSSLVKEHSWPASKLKPTRIFINEISNFMEVSRNPLNNLQAADQSKPTDFIKLAKSRDILINILYQGSSVKDELTLQDATAIIRVMERTKVEILSPTYDKSAYNRVTSHKNFVDKLKQELPLQMVK